MSGMSGEYYFNTLTGEVEHGRVSSWNNRLGPYPTLEAAQAALETAKQRTQEWTDEENQDDEPSSDVE